MKKSLIALAVAGALTAPVVAQADATLYGSFRMGLIGAGDHYDDIKGKKVDGDLDLRDESTRIGIKGDVDLGLENTKGLFQWEANVATLDNDGDMFKARLALMGLTGNWGTALVGKQYHPYYTMVNSHTNIFQGADADFGEAFALGNVNHKRADNTLAYASPVMAGFQAVAGVVIAGDGDDDNQNFDEDVDGYNIGAQYTGVEGLRLSASYGNVDAAVAALGGIDYESDIWGLGATYNIDALTLAAKYEEREDSYSAGAAGVDLEWTVWELAAQYQIGATALKARYGNIDLDVGGSLLGLSSVDVADGDQWGIEVEHKLGNRGYAWIGYTDFDEEAAGLAALQQKVTATSSVSEDLWMIGYRLDF